MCVVYAYTCASVYGGADEYMQVYKCVSVCMCLCVHICVTVCVSSENGVCVPVFVSVCEYVC